MNNLNLRREIITTAQQFNATGLSVGKSGNVSARTPEGMLITPSGVPYDDLTPGAIVETDIHGKPVNRKSMPSSEWRFHLQIYRSRPAINAIVHVHSPYATAIACTRKGIPAIHYHIALAGGGSIRCARYATFGTEKLARNALKALEGRYACLLANHGQIALGESVSSALGMAREVEQLARLYCIARLIGKPVFLEGEEVKINVKKFRSYGRQEE
jgi:L-fuculose-phosphate aldolase